MKLEEIQLMWERDAQIDRTELGEESLRIPQLHSKYFKIFSQERLLLRKMEVELKQLYKNKFEWYNGSISEETLKIGNSGQNCEQREHSHDPPLAQGVCSGS